MIEKEFLEEEAEHVVEFYLPVWARQVSDKVYQYMEYLRDKDEKELE